MFRMERSLAISARRMIFPVRSSDVVISWNICFKFSHNDIAVIYKPRSKILMNSTKLTPLPPLTHLGLTFPKQLKPPFQATASKRPSLVDPPVSGARVRLAKTKSALGVLMIKLEDTDDGIISWEMVEHAKDGACL